MKYYNGSEWKSDDEKFKRYFDEKFTSIEEYVDKIDLFLSFPVREPGETFWIQGVSINESKGKIYTSNQKNDKLRIDIRDLKTGNRESSKEFTTVDGAYSESLIWWEENENLYFIVSPGGSPGVDNSYGIINYTTGEITSTDIPIKGYSRMTLSGKYLITSDWSVNTGTKFFMYSWESVKQGNPELIKTTTLKDFVNIPSKLQGIAAIGNYIVMSHGSQTSLPAISIFTLDGEYVSTRCYVKNDLKEAINESVPDTLTGNLSADLFYESEGIYTTQTNVYSVHCIDDDNTDTDGARVYILRHGGRSKIQHSVNEIPVTDRFLQVNLVPDTGVTHVSGQELSATVRKGEVRFKGNLRSTVSGGPLLIGTLPSDLPKPTNSFSFPVPGPTQALRNISLLDTGDINLWSSTTSTSWISFSMGRYSI